MMTLAFTIKTDKVLEAFKHYDDDNSGELDMAEFRAALKDLGINVTDAQFDRVVNEIDQNGDEMIDKEEFEHAVKILDCDVSEAAGRGRRIKVILTTIVIWIFLGTGYFVACEGGDDWDFANTLYFSFVTLTTIGLGDLFPETTAGRVGLIVFALLGLGLLATTLDLVSALIEDIKAARERRLAEGREAAIAAKRQNKVE